MIENFRWERNNHYFSWSYKEKELKKEYNNNIWSVIKLSDNNGFAIVLSHEDYGRHNAFIINADGTERYRLDTPTSIKNVICFHEIYYINGELTAIIATTEVDFAYNIDPNSVNFNKIYETR